MTRSPLERSPGAPRRGSLSHAAAAFGNLIQISVLRVSALEKRNPTWICPVSDNRECPTMPDNSYLLSPARSLREACRETGRDAEGKAGVDCPVADLCEREARRMVERR